MKTLSIAAVLALLLAAPAVAEDNIPIETLLKAGWQIGGYASANQPAVESAMTLLRIRTSRTCSAAQVTT